MPTTCTRVRLAVAFALLVSLPSLAVAQTAAAPAAAPATNSAPWEKEIKAFEAADAASMPAPGGIVFIGSSSIRLWKTLAQDFPDAPVLNRGFGGSQVPDSTAFIPRIVTPYKPRLVVMYAGGNDINAGATPEQVAASVRTFVDAVRKTLPSTRIAYISIAGNPARWAQVDRVRKANQLIEAYTKATPNMAFIDVFTPMLGADGLPRPEIFVEDRLHMNDNGYRIWTRVVEPYLAKP
jgi:lysophospholipase L1-like esterase